MNRFLKITIFIVKNINLLIENFPILNHLKLNIISFPYYKVELDVRRHGSMEEHWILTIVHGYPVYFIDIKKMFFNNNTTAVKLSIIVKSPICYIFPLIVSQLYHFSNYLLIYSIFFHKWTYIYIYKKHFSQTNDTTFLHQFSLLTFLLKNIFIKLHL